MSRRFILFLGLAILMALTGIVMSSRKGLFGLAPFGPDDSPGPVAPTNTAGGGSGELKPRPFSPTAGRAVPLARVTLDGRAGDWAEVKPFIEHRPGMLERSTYGCRTIRLARDREHLYVLLDLDRGVAEALAAARGRPSGRPGSGRVGILDFDTEGRRFSLRVSAGYSVARGPAPSKPQIEPITHVDVYRYDPRRLVISAGSRGRGAVVAFDGKTIEVKLPFSLLGLTEARRVEAVFEGL